VASGTRGALGFHTAHEPSPDLHGRPHYTGIVPGRIRRSDIDELRTRINIADVVGDYVTLKPAGSGSLKGLCPFHDERSPSFHVRPHVGYYHCFGCGEGGDVFTFVQKMDSRGFTETIEYLAEKAGFTLTYEDGQAAPERKNRSRIFAANQAAEAFFREQLHTPAAEPGRAFLAERGFDQLAAERFGVGFAPDSYDALSGHLTKKGFSVPELIEAGLVSQGDRGVYDRFRGRLIWPIRDVTGQTIGFGARRLGDDDRGPKYLNTPDTEVYHKSRVLYGLDLAKRDIAKKRQVVIVEGYTDVMACHLAGISTAVATCGTAFGADHIPLIRRVMGDGEAGVDQKRGEVIFTFDPDEAGQKAATKAFYDQDKFSANVFVAVPPEGLDPCDVRLHRGDEALSQVIESRKPMYEFMIKRVLDRVDLNTVEGRSEGLRSAIDVVKTIRDPIIRDGYAREIAGWVGMDPSQVSAMVRSAPTSTAKPADRPLPPGQETSDAPAAYQVASLPQDPMTLLERDVLAVLVQLSADISPERAAAILQATFTHGALQVVRDAMVSAFDHYGKTSWVGALLEEIPDTLTTFVQQLAVYPLPEKTDNLARFGWGVTSSFLDRDLLRRKAELLGALQRMTAEDDKDKYRALQQNLMDIEAARRELRSD
jgi:DNA primase